ncbi:uncharacterized protein LOC106013887 [Aplysia californica]|uniref:Uncharacterized protein LOC106013887 n=1 Tax=Aplysia californica TaxID=6500 RepID=A0ABM1AEI9_APLCA|nr:uncharacterized protein LOC106013887 [Aplysia californica]
MKAYIGRLIKITAFTNSEFGKKLEKLKESLNEATDRVNKLGDTGKEHVATVTKMREDFGTGGRVMELLRADSRAVIDQIVTEGQITREVVRGERETQGTYTCDFYVTEFSHWVGAGVRHYSRLWYIDQSKTYLKGRVGFGKDKTMDVWLVHGRYPHVVGLAGQTGGRRVRVSVAVVRQTGTGDNWELGSKVVNFDETAISVRCDGWECAGGYRVASAVSCDEMYTRGLVDGGNKVLFRYTITVL